MRHVQAHGRAAWPKAQRKLWVQLLEGSFELIYQDLTEPESKP